VQVGTAQFSTTQGDFATSSAIASGAFRINKDTSKVLVIKGDMSSICTSCDISTSGDFVKVDYDGQNVGINGNYGVGVSSGSNVSPTATDTRSEGIRIFKGYPSFAAVTGWQPTTSVSNGDQPLFRFSVKANGNDVGIYKLTFRMSTTSIDVANENVFAYTDSAFSSPVPGLATAAGQVASSTTQLMDGVNDGSSDIGVYVSNSSNAHTVLHIPSGSTYYFEFRGTLSGAVDSGDTISVQLQGDGDDYSDASDQMGTALQVDEMNLHDDLIWTPNSLTAPSTNTSNDWTNGYLVPGLPTNNMSSQVLSR
jgi:hypothetical protein